MSNNVWRGDAQPRPQVDSITPANVGVGDIFTVTINRKDISVTATAATVANVVGLLVSAIGQYNNSIDEFAEVSASAGNTVSGGVTTYSTYVKITGPTDGKPFTMTASAANGESFTITVTTLQDGSAAINEVQRVVLQGPPTGGTFTLSFEGQTTAAIAYNASAATLKTAFELLSTVGAGQSSVALNAQSDWSITFTGTLAGVDTSQITGAGNSLTGGASCTASTTTQGQAGQNEKWLLTNAAGDLQSFRFKSSANGGPYYSGYIGGGPGIAASQIQAILEIMTGAGGTYLYGPGNVVVTGAAGGPWAVEWTGTLANTAMADDLTIDSAVFSSGGSTTWAETQEGNATPVNEVQKVTINNTPTGGTFTLGFRGSTTAGIAYNAAAATVQTAFEGLGTVGAGQCTVTGSAGGPYTFTFGGTMAATDVQQIIATGTGLTGSKVSTSTDTSGAPGVNESQQFIISPAPSGGTFTLSINSGAGVETTGNIAYNATAATVQTAIEALATPVPGDILVTGASPSYVVNFKGALASKNIALSTGDGTLLTAGGSQTNTRASVTVPTGPNWVNDAENWSTGVAPAAADVIIFDDPNAADVLYGIDLLSAVTVAKIVIRQSFENKKIGLPDHTGLYYEYRPTEFAIGFTEFECGTGVGAGIALCRMNAGTVQYLINGMNTGTSQNSSLAAVNIRGTNASNAAEILGGDWSFATDQADLNTLLTLKIAKGDQAGSAPTVFCGPGCTLATVENDGGSLETNSAIGTAFTQNSGTTFIKGSGAVAQLTGLGGTIIYNTGGTLGGATVLSGDCTLDFSQDMTAKTVTNPIDIYSSDAKVLDPYKVVNAGAGPVLDFNQIPVSINGSMLGKNRRLTPGTAA